MKKILLLTSICITLISCSTPPATEINSGGTVIKKGRGDVIDPVHGKQTEIWYGALSGTGGTNANGVAFIRKFEDGSARINLNLNIALAPTGTKYTAQLQSNMPTKSVAIAIGDVTSIVGDARHSASTETKLLTEDFTEVVIHSLQNGVGKVIATGTMKKSPK